MNHSYPVLATLSVLTAILWGWLWVPFGTGYYGLPWRNPALQVGVQVWAWLHLFGTLLLVRYGGMHKRTWWPIALAALVSGFSLTAMYNWMAMVTP